MSWMKKLPGSQKTPYGLEVKILKKIPKVALLSTLVIAIFVAVGHWMPPEGTASEVNKHLEMVNIFGIAVLITVWTAIFTVAVGAFVVYVMKGPGYVADGFEVSDSDKPKP